MFRRVETFLDKPFLEIINSPWMEQGSRVSFFNLLTPFRFKFNRFVQKEAGKVEKKKSLAFEFAKIGFIFGGRLLCENHFSFQ